MKKKMVVPIIALCFGTVASASEQEYQIVNIANVYAEIPAEWIMEDVSDEKSFQLSYIGNGVNFYINVSNKFDEDLSIYDMKSSVEVATVDVIESIYDEYEILKSQDYGSGGSYAHQDTAQCKLNGKDQAISVYSEYSDINNTFLFVAAVSAYSYDSVQTAEYFEILNHAIDTLAIVYPYDDETFNEDYEVLESEYNNLKEKYDDLSNEYEELKESLQTETETEAETVTVTDIYAETEDETTEEITFRDVPWGSSYTEVNSLLSDLNLWNLVGELYRTYSVDEIILGDYEGLDFEINDINIIAYASNDEINVAGYTTDEICLFFSYVPVDGILTRSEEDSALYGARYRFEPNNLSEMTQDLTEKLSSLYGEPDEIKTDSHWLYNVQYEYIYWYGANDTEVVLKSVDASGDETDLYDDEIYISYVWTKGDELLQIASDTLSQNNKDAEAELYGNGSTDGL